MNSSSFCSGQILEVLHYGKSSWTLMDAHCPLVLEKRTVADLPVTAERVQASVLLSDFLQCERPIFAPKERL